MKASTAGWSGPTESGETPSLILTATADKDGELSVPAARARAFAEPLLANAELDTGENILAHADAVVGILEVIGGSEAMKTSCYLVYAWEHLNRPRDVIAKAFGTGYADLADEASRLIQLQRQARLMAKQARQDRTESVSLDAHPAPKPPVSELAASQTENIRKMLLAFSRDLRVVMLRLASRLQTLRYFAASKRLPPHELAWEALHVFAPLANRLGIWQIKWELEDLAFRFLEPENYKQIARMLDEKRTERETYMMGLRAQFESELAAQHIDAQVQGRPKHIYSIAKKMRGKSLDFGRVFDIRAVRVVVSTVADCYAVLAWVHDRFTPIAEEFDDYIAQPKPNGYQSLHTVVRDGQGRAIEVQIRTQDMHDHAEHGVAAHWAYKEAGAKGYAGVSASSEYDNKIAVLRQLLAWEQDISGTTSALFDDRIYVFTPDASIVELPAGGTPVDFAYTVHTQLGHRCRGAKVDGVMVPLNTPLKSGQTVEILAAKEGGPSRDWINADLGYLASPRARAKVRAWFNSLALESTIARGREAVEKLLQREGKTSLALDDLALQMGFSSSQQLFEVVGKDELSLKAVESQLSPPEASLPEDAVPVVQARKSTSQSGGQVLVVGVDSMLTQLAKCCKPVPPDAIGGFVTRGKGVSIHRADCHDFRYLVRTHPDRVISVQWRQQRAPGAGHGVFYPVDVAVEARDRQGLLRDISEVFSKEKINVIGVQTQSMRGMASMTFTAEVSDSSRVKRVLQSLKDVEGVQTARRK
ncbi:RelA/SpoT family protein [Hydrogenophaga soli]